MSSSSDKSMDGTSGGIGQKVRTLGAGEEALYLVEHVTSAGPSFMIEIEGTRTESEWRDAIKKLQNLHPVMSTSVRKKLGERPEYFNNGKAIEPTFRQWTSDFSIEREMEKSMEHSFGDQTEFQFRFNIYQGSGKTFIGGSYSHTPYDGKSGLMLINDLLDFAGDSTLTKNSYPFPPILSSLVEVSVDWTYKPKASPTEVTSSDSVYPVRVRTAKFSRDMVDALRNQARDHGTTVHGVLAAAFSKCASKNPKEPFSLLSPIDMRPLFENMEIPGLLASQTLSRIEDWEGRSIWDIAKQVKTDLTAAFNKSVLHQQSLGPIELLSTQPQPQDLMDMFSKMVGDLALSNYGAQKTTKSQYNDLKLKSFYISNAPRNCIKIDVLNHKGELFITSVFEPNIMEGHEGLLQRVEDLLRKELNCDANSKA